MSDCFVLYLLLTCMKKKTSGADKFTNNRQDKSVFFWHDLIVYGTFWLCVSA